MTKIIISGTTHALHTSSCQDTTFDLSALLDAKKKEMIDHFKSQINDGHMITNAKKLQDFFNALVIVQNNRKTKTATADEQALINAIGVDTMKKIIDKAADIAWKGKYKDVLVSRMDGFQVEDAISAIINATIQEVAVHPEDLNNISSQSGGFSFVAGKPFKDKLLIEMSQAKVGQVTEKMSKRFAQGIAATSNKGKKYVKFECHTISNTKVDVNGRIYSSIELSASAAQPLLEIAQLLSQAAFSVKGYHSVRQDPTKVETGPDGKIHKGYSAMALSALSIHLGASQLENVFSALFKELPPEIVVALSFFALQTKDKNLIKEINFLRFIYDLTGYGQTVKVSNKMNQLMKDYYQSEFGRSDMSYANYLIWYDPSTGNAYVKSSAELIIDVEQMVVNELRKDIDIRASMMAK